jgi:phosphohistidine phosphatase
MKRLTLLRHAKSSWSDPRLADHERPLNERGKRAVPQMAERYAQHPMGTPDRIVTSDAVRAKKTALRFRKVLADHGRDVEVEERSELYMAESPQYFETLWSLDDGLQHVVLVGHNPGLHQFVNELLAAEPVESLPTAALVVIRFEQDHWAAVQQKSGRRLLYWQPKRLGFN